MIDGYEEGSDDWNGINPDGTPNEKTLENIVQSLVTTTNPLQIILFRSGARGQMHADSDIDLLIVKKTESTDAVADNAYLALYSNKTILRDVDIFVITPEEMEGEKADEWVVTHAALKEGRIIYGAKRTDRKINRARIN